MYTVKIKCAYRTNGVLYDTVGVLITIIKVWLALPQCHHNTPLVWYAHFIFTCINSHARIQWKYRRYTNQRIMCSYCYSYLHFSSFSAMKSCLFPLFKISQNFSKAPGPQVINCSKIILFFSTLLVVLSSTCCAAYCPIRFDWISSSITSSESR